MNKKVKSCCRCKRKKRVSQFDSNRSKSDGLSHTCRPCQRAYSRAHYEANKEMYKERVQRNNKRYLKELYARIAVLKDVPCKDCKVKYPPYVMDFDHLGDKKFSIGEAVRKWAGSQHREDIFEEIKKCEVVCANCHRERTHQRHKKRPL